MPDPTRTLYRGLLVLEQLDRLSPASLAELTEATALPKATVLRLLRTLVACGWAHRRTNDGRYGLARSTGETAPEAVRPTRLARIAAPVLRDLTAATSFPADFTVVAAPGMLEIVESTRTRQPGGVDPLVVGFRPSLVFSAPGRAVLAACEAEARARHPDHLQRADIPAERYFVSSGALDTELRRTRARGWAVRAAGYWPDSSDYGEEPMDIAVVVTGGEEPTGAVSIVWPAARHAPEDVAARHLSSLIRSAERLNALTK